MNKAKALIDGDILVYRIGFSVNDPEDEKFAIARMGNFVEKLLNVDDIDSYTGFITGKSN